MLVLNRKAGESFTIDGQIKIKILNEFGNVRVGIEAPKHMRIVRDESTEKKSRNKNKTFGCRCGIQHENTRS